MAAQLMTWVWLACSLFRSWTEKLSFAHIPIDLPLGSAILCVSYPDLLTYFTYLQWLGHDTCWKIM